MNRRWNDSRLRDYLRDYLRDPWNQTHLFVFGVILPAVGLIAYWMLV